MAVETRCSDCGASTLPIGEDGLCSTCRIINFRPSQEGGDPPHDTVTPLETPLHDWDVADVVDVADSGGEGAALEDVAAFVERYVSLPSARELHAVALFVVHTWTLDGAHATPYLWVRSPEKRSGKTRLLEVLELVVRSPWRVTSASEAAMFRKIEQDRPTLLLDEIDPIFASSSERTEALRAILNSGNRPGASVDRKSVV